MVQLIRNCCSRMLGPNRKITIFGIKLHNTAADFATKIKYYICRLDIVSLPYDTMSNYQLIRQVFRNCELKLPHFN